MQARVNRPLSILLTTPSTADLDAKHWGGGPTLSEADNIDRHFWSGGRDLHAFSVRGDRFLEGPNLS